MPKIPLTLLAVPLCLALTACGSDKKTSTTKAEPGTGGGTNPGGGGTNPGGGGGTNPGGGGTNPGGGGTQEKGCTVDQGGKDKGGCEPGFVCDLTTNKCVKGKSCKVNNDCRSCSIDVNGGAPVDCGHGFTVNSWCDASHGNVCVRSRAICETCETDAECGYANLSTAPNVKLACVADAKKQKVCSIPVGQGKPPGMIPNAIGGKEYLLPPGGCPAEVTFCPAPTGSAKGVNGQIRPGKICDADALSICSTNRVQGMVGVCIRAACSTDTDCDTGERCNSKGFCTPGCRKGDCAQGLVCHMDGKCGEPCADDNACTSNDDFGEMSFCNDKNGSGDRRFKDHKDEHSCQAQGCEQATDCPEAGIVCDRAQQPPQCVAGCHNNDDCTLSVCRTGEPGTKYDRDACRALPAHNDNNEIGVCCSPGCIERANDCPQHLPPDPLSSITAMLFCCGEEGSPFEDPDTCWSPAVGGAPAVKALPGECFRAGEEADRLDTGADPFCTPCAGPADCNSSWPYGPTVDGAKQPQQEFCLAAGEIQGSVRGICGVTCDPSGGTADHGCPKGNSCSAITFSCLEDSECNTGTCEGADTESNPPVRGHCVCGTVADCPTTYQGVTVTHPTCRPREGMPTGVCVASYNCKAALFRPADTETTPPTPSNYSDVCINRLVAGP